jgi:excinuclease ABC subunit A
VTSLPLRELAEFFSSVTWSERERAIGGLVLKEIGARLKFLLDVGLDYLTLERPTWTLSGGESQRIRLATQIGSGLVGVLYILDEPSVGLHHRDHARLLRTLKALRDLGNTVLVVEHDRDTILESDHVIDMGPKAGVLGGLVVAEGKPAEIQAHAASLTGQYLSGRMKVYEARERRRGNGKFLTVKGARHNNLKGITVRIPLGVMTCVTGVSGSGKSSLAIDTLYRGLARRLERSRETCGEVQDILGWQMLDRVIDIDQSPIGRTPRSNPATYVGMFTLIRELFAKLPEARARGYGSGRFSFNVKGGRCEACLGAGIVRIEMHFLPDAFVTCELCKGRRYNRETLEVLYKGKSIADVLDLTIGEAQTVFSSFPAFRQRLEVLRNVGLDYLHLGQPGTTLSGGEAQRVKLGKELVKRTTGRFLYVLDEPTTGLHFDDIRRLLDVLDRLVDQGNTVIVIEHNLDVIPAADFIIDLGPEGGANGGEVVAVGTPEEIASVESSYTGQCLRAILQDHQRPYESGRFTSFG